MPAATASPTPGPRTAVVAGRRRLRQPRGRRHEQGAAPAARHPGAGLVAAHRHSPCRTSTRSSSWPARTTRTPYGDLAERYLPEGREALLVTGGPTRHDSEWRGPRAAARPGSRPASSTSSRSTTGHGRWPTRPCSTRCRARRARARRRPPGAPAAGPGHAATAAGTSPGWWACRPRRRSGPARCSTPTPARRPTASPAPTRPSCVAAYTDLPVRGVPAPATNLKVTFAEDLALAERLLGEPVTETAWPVRPQTQPEGQDYGRGLDQPQVGLVDDPAALRRGLQERTSWPARSAGHQVREVVGRRQRVERGDHGRGQHHRRGDGEQARRGRRSRRASRRRRPSRCR